jgi:hypothetical protein
MAQDFEKAVGLNVGTSPATILTSDSDDAVIGVRLSNIHTSAINVSVYITHNDGGGDDNYYLIKDASIPPASALEVIQGGSKVVMQSGDDLVVVSDTASSCDVWCSYIDTISA